MHSNDKKTAFYFQADANTVGGFLQAPEPKGIPSQASVSLPIVGIATARTEAFNLEGIISVAAAYARVSGRQAHADGSVSVLVTSVIEGLNLLEVVTADRIVAQIAVEYLVNGGRRISLAGSHFEGLRVGGQDVLPSPNTTLLQLPGGKADSPPVDWVNYFRRTGSVQADRLIESVEKGNGDAGEWLLDRYRWMGSKAKTPSPDWALCSLVDGFAGDLPGKSLGHIVEIAEFGRFIFAELLASPTSIRLSMIRAELGCNVQGNVGIGTVTTNGTTIPPGKPH